MIQFLLRHTPLLYLTQSLWRDEAFSILSAEKPLAFLLPKLGFEPPFYYVLLHFWIKIFGRSELSTRGLSLLGFTLATVVVIHWGEKLFKKHWLSWFLPLFFFLNPMLIYYAFEVRTYGWYMFFATLSMYAYMEKRWKLYVAATALGFYTHTYMIFVPFVQVLHWLMTNGHFVRNRSIGKLLRDPALRAFLAVGVLIAPWLWKVVQESARLKNSWYFPVNFQLVRAVLGNMFLGYEGTPWYLWAFTPFLSLIILGLSAFALANRAHRKRNVFFFLIMTVPLAIIIGISFKKPLFVNRYLIPASIAEVFMLVFALEAIKNSMVQKILAVCFMAFIVGFNLWYPDKHAKLDIRMTIHQINQLQGKSDVVLAESPLIFFESVYYSKTPSRVFLYNPSGTAFPWYVGDAIFSESQMVRSLPPYPIRAFVVSENGLYHIAYDTEITFVRPAKLPAKRKP